MQNLCIQSLPDRMAVGIYTQVLQRGDRADRIKGSKRYKIQHFAQSGQVKITVTTIAAKDRMIAATMMPAAILPLRISC